MFCRMLGGNKMLEGFISAVRALGYSHGGGWDTNEGWLPYPTVVNDVIMNTHVLSGSQSPFVLSGTKLPVPEPMYPYEATTITSQRSQAAAGR